MQVDALVNPLATAKADWSRAGAIANSVLKAAGDGLKQVHVIVLDVSQMHLMDSRWTAWPFINCAGWLANNGC